MKLIKRKFTNENKPLKQKLFRKKSSTPEIGRWCTMIINRLPYPIECHTKASLNPICRACDHKVEYTLWREGVYEPIKIGIKNGVDYVKYTQERENFLSGQIKNRKD